jgi:alanine or glycine:cation symporter, AGCS family
MASRHYFDQRRAGVEPVFHLARHPDLAKGVDPTIWK